VVKAFRFIPALCAVLFAVMSLVACGGIPGNAVVDVAGNPITKSTFSHWLVVAAAAGTAREGGKPVPPDPPRYTQCIAHEKAAAGTAAKGLSSPTEAQLKKQCEQQYTTLRQEVLGFLISSEWVLGESGSLGVKATDAEVKKRFEQIKTQQFTKPADFEKFLASSGQTVSDLLLRVKLNLLSQKIQQKVANSKTTISQTVIEKYYNANKQRFGTPEHRSVEIILTKSEPQAKKAKQEVQSGQSFASVAKRVSIDPTSKANGGLLVAIKGQQEPSLDTAMFSAAVNVLSGPVKTPFGFYVLEVKSITAGTQQTLAQAQASIKQQLTATAQQAALSKFVKNFKKKWTSKTDCRAGFVVLDCKQYKAPKTPQQVIP
jgi:parvulin-like peptidyl-prolyl isomerase